MDGVMRPRGTTTTAMRAALCKDCRRDPALQADPAAARFVYSETSAMREVDRGGSRSDRCPGCRRKHRKAVAALSVAYIDLQTIGAVRDRQNPTGPLGGLGPLPYQHALEEYPTDLADYQFGMTDADILKALSKLAARRVLVLKAGTGTGKSTFAPFRLAVPPDGAAIRLLDAGPIVVTEPRVQATTRVARFVGTHLAGTGVGPGHLVGYQVAGDRNHDAACQVVYVTDGTMINWLREGRLDRIGTVIVDEVHERSTNIDFILGYLRRELARYPHLRVVVTSATFDPRFYVEYFGGEDVVDWMEVPAAKSFGYGEPLFPQEEIGDMDAWLAGWWPQFGPEDESGEREDLWATTRILHGLRSPRILASEDSWRTDMPALVAEQIQRMVDGLDDAGIEGDVLAFLPTRKAVEAAVGRVKATIAGERADTYDLLRTTRRETIELALETRPKGAKRKILIASNLAETSLTVSGVRFVIDSGLIAQSEWDPNLATGWVPTKPHSQAGIRQRWGRVGRDGPGWVFPLYSREQFARLARDTPPGSTRENQEQLVMKAKSAGIDDAADFVWPAGFSSDAVEMDETATRFMDVFRRELARANQALSLTGAVDADGHLTAFGRELERFPGSAEEAVAIMLADQLACVPEVAVALHLLARAALSAPSGLLRNPNPWPPEWQLEALQRRSGLAHACGDDLDLVLSVHAGWEAADAAAPPWERTPLRDAWADAWWVNGELLHAAATRRYEVLESLSPAMKQEVKRRIDLRLVPRTRAVLSMAMRASTFRRSEDSYVPTGGNDGHAYLIDSSTLTRPGDSIIALIRRTDNEGEHRYLQNIVNVVPWAAGAQDSFDLIQRAAMHDARTDTALLDASALRARWPIGARILGEILPAGDRALFRGEVVGAPLRYMDPAPDDPDAEGAVEAEDEDSVRDETKWTGNPNPIPDEERLERIAILDPRELETNDDLDGDDALFGTSAGTSARPSGSTVVPLRQVVAAVPVLGGAFRPGTGRFVIAGYTHVDGQPAIEIEEDWLVPESRTEPTLGNEDLVAGDTMRVLVGRTVTYGRRAMTVFIRSDGRGRFVLLTPPGRRRRLERGHLGVALDPNDVTLLERLEKDAMIPATIMPTRWRATTVTFLPALYAHLAQAHPARLIPQSSTTGAAAPYLPATLLDEPNEFGWATVVLDHRESGIGLDHRFGVKADVLQSAGIDPKPGSACLVQLRVGTPDTRHLRVDDIEWDLADVLAAFPRRVHVAELKRDGLVIDGRWLRASQPIVPQPVFARLFELMPAREDKLRLFEWSVSCLFHRVAAVMAPDRERIRRAEVGRIYRGRVVRIMPFGAFVEVEPNEDGLVHISRLTDHRVERVEEVVNIGDEIVVKVVEIDSQGRLNLSRQEAIEELSARGELLDERIDMDAVAAALSLPPPPDRRRFSQGEM